MVLVYGTILVVILTAIVFAGIIPASAEEIKIPEWVKTTLVMWTNGEISDQEFVVAIDYLKSKGIVKLSSVNEEEIQRQIEYLKAKNEVIRKEVEDLREINEEYRISLKSQEINKGSTTSISQLLGEYEALQKEVKILRETNKQFANQINSWMNSNQMANKVVGNIDDENKIVQIESHYVKKLNELKQEAQDYKNKIEELQKESLSYEKDIQLLKIENENKNDALKLLRSKNQANRDDVKQLIQGNEFYDNLVTNIHTENLEQKKKLTEYENIIKTFDSNFDILNKKQTNMEKEILSENEKLKKQIDSLQIEIKQKHQEINSLKNMQLEKESNRTYVIQPPELPTLQYDDHQEKLDEIKKQSNKYLVEVNYLKAKNIVIDEEIDTLRAENEEYRILINLLKKGEKSQTEIASANHDNISSNQGSVVMYKTVDEVKHIPKDWISKIDSTKKYSIYVEPTPKWSLDVSGEVNNAIKFWKETAGVNLNVVNTPDVDTVIISWKKTLPNNYDGYTTNQKQVEVALGSYGCDKNWRAYDSKSVRDILIHELGHILNLGHAIDKSNIMYPMIYSAKFAPVDTTITIDTKDSAFIKTCSFSADPSYKYVVKTQDTTKKFDLFFVPSDAEKQTFDAGKQFDYYSDINCIGLGKSVQSGTCKNVVDTGGLLIINSENNEKITVTVHIEEK